MVRAGGLKSLPAFLGRLLRLSDTAVRAALLHECLQSFSAVQTNSLVIHCLQIFPHPCFVPSMALPSFLPWSAFHFACALRAFYDFVMAAFYTPYISQV